MGRNYCDEKPVMKNVFRMIVKEAKLKDKKLHYRASVDESKKAKGGIPHVWPPYFPICIGA